MHGRSGCYGVAVCYSYRIRQGSHGKLDRTVLFRVSQDETRSDSPFLLRRLENFMVTNAQIRKMTETTRRSVKRTDRRGVRVSQTTINMAERRELGLSVTKQGRAVVVEVFDPNSDASVSYRHRPDGRLVRCGSVGLPPRLRRLMPLVFASEADVRASLDRCREVFQTRPMTRKKASV